MRVAVFLPERHDWPAMLDAARAAEAAGFDRVLLPDHLAYGSPQLEAWTAMAALAASTTRVGLGFSVLSAIPSPAQRIALLDECCATLRRLCERPLPLVIGSSGDRALEVVARHADEWNCGAAFLDRAAERLARLASLTQRPIARSVNLPVWLGQPIDPERARRHNVHLALHGTVDQMVARCAELCQLGFDGVWLSGLSDRATFERSLELLPYLRKL